MTPILFQSGVGFNLDPNAGSVVSHVEILPSVPCLPMAAGGTDISIAGDHPSQLEVRAVIQT